MSLSLPVIATLRKTIDLGLQRGLFRVGDIAELSRACGALDAEEQSAKMPPQPPQSPSPPVEVPPQE